VAWEQPDGQVWGDGTPWPTPLACRQAVVARAADPPAGQASASLRRLASLAINETVLATMTIRYNKALAVVCTPKWTHVGAVDLVQKSTIGDLILLACAKSNTTVPFGEPA
jgi:hypothetical protein